MQTTPQERIDDFTARGWWGAATLSSLFESAVASVPERLALVDAPDRPVFSHGDPQRHSFADLERETARLTAALHEHGIVRDDIVVVQLPNIAELVLVYLAAARLGVIVSPVPVQYGRHELAMVAKAVEPAAFISTTRFKQHNLLAEHLKVFDANCRAFAWGPDVTNDAVSLGDYAPSAEAQAACRDYCEAQDASANDIFTICWTSGTTGQPKGVPRSYNQWLATAGAVQSVADLGDGDALLNPFPLVNMAGIGGFLFCWLNCRAKLVLHQPLDLPMFLRQIGEEQISYTIAPPAILNMLASDEKLLAGIDLSTLKAIGSGSAPLSPWMIETFHGRHGIAILNNFGSNEGITLTAGAEDVPDPAQRAVLFPRFGVEGYNWSNPAAAMTRTRIVDLDSGEQITEPNRPGELLIWGATVFDGYWRSPEANRAVFTEDGFFRTGDLLEIAGDGDDERFYRFVGRCKDIIVRGGMKISPDELDTLLAAHPKLAEASVVGYDDPILGEKVGAVVVPKPGESVELADITDFLRAEDIAVFKLPERLQVIKQLPRNPLGKVVRGELRQYFNAGESS